MRVVAAEKNRTGVPFRFVNFDFPDDLLAAQRELHRIAADLQAAYEALPRTVEPLPGSPGWTDEQQQQIGDLRARRLELATTVFTHPYWAGLEGPEAVRARSALKHADGVKA